LFFCVLAILKIRVRSFLKSVSICEICDLISLFLFCVLVILQIRVRSFLESVSICEICDLISLEVTFVILG
jgi:hypothetical protein